MLRDLQMLLLMCLIWRCSYNDWVKQTTKLVIAKVSPLFYLVLKQWCPTFLILRVSTICKYYISVRLQPYTYNSNFWYVQFNSKISELQQTIVAVVREPTATQPRPNLGSRRTGWESLFQILYLTMYLKICKNRNAWLPTSDTLRSLGQVTRMILLRSESPRVV